MKTHILFFIMALFPLSSSLHAAPTAFLSTGIGMTFEDKGLFFELSGGLSEEGIFFAGGVLNINQSGEFLIGGELGAFPAIGVDYLYNISLDRHIIRAYPTYQNVLPINWNLMVFPYWQYDFHAHAFGLSLKFPLATNGKEFSLISESDH